MATSEQKTRAADDPPPPATAEGPFGEGLYWFTSIVSLVSLVILWLYYGSFGWVRLLYWAGVVLALGLLAWSAGSLMARYQLVERLGASAARFRETREGGDGEEQVVYRENVVVRLFKFVWRLITLLFLFVWNTFLRLLFIAILIILYSVLIAYDILYWTLYLAWTLGRTAGGLALRIALWALRVAWRILRILTFLPIAKGLWRNRWRPVIMGKWNHRVERVREQKRLYVERKRRFAALKGKDPDKWQADWELRRHFPMPHPTEGRKGIRDRIEERKRLDYNRRDRWAAYRQGRPIPPKLHSERKKRQQQEREEQRQKKKAAAAGKAKGAKRPDPGRPDPVPGAKRPRAAPSADE